MIDTKKNNHGIRTSSDVKNGMESFCLALAKLFFGVLVVDEDHGTCGMFTGSPNCFNSLEVTPLVMIFFNILTGFSPLNRAVCMIVIARATFVLPRAVIFPKVIFRNITAFLIFCSAQLFVGLTAGYLRKTKSSFLNFSNRLRILSESWCDNGACRRSLLNRLRIPFLPERYSSEVNVVC